MAGKRYKTGTRRKRKTRRVRITRAPSSGLPNSSKKSPFGQTHTSNFNYVEKITITSGVLCGLHTFRLNSMFDPNYTGTGHQALFRDVFSGIYSRYRVNSVKYKITPLT